MAMVENTVTVTTTIKVKRSLSLVRGSTDEIASAAAESFRHEFGGQLLYIPKGFAFDIDERDKEIYRKFDGTNHNDLAVEFGHSVQHIYRIIAQARRAMRGSQRASG